MLYLHIRIIYLIDLGMVLLSLEIGCTSGRLALCSKNNCRVQSITTKFHTELNLVMNGLIKQIFTPN